MLPYESPAVRRSRLSMIWKFIRASLYYWFPVGLFVWLANDITRGDGLPGDTTILIWLNQFATPALDRAMVFITAFGSAAVIGPALFAAVTLLYLIGRRRQAWFVAFSIGGTGIINALFKLLFERSRPSLWEQIIQETGYSFPSGHAMISFAVAMTVILLLWHTRFRIAAVIVGILFCLLISLSRLYLGVHYPSDIVAGWSISFVWILLLHRILGSSRKKTASNPV